jgi:hypothetical protein
VKIRFQSGVWEGRLTARDTVADAPDLRLLQDGHDHPAPRVTAAAGTPDAWDVRVKIPVSALGDGIRVFLVTDAASGAVLMRLPVLAGEDLADDLRAEVAVLRAELDQLRGAFQTAMRTRSLGD